MKTKINKKSSSLVKMMPMDDRMEIPSDPASQTVWMRDLLSMCEDSEEVFSGESKKGGYRVSAGRGHGHCWVIQIIREASLAEQMSVWILKDTDQDLEDAKRVAEFLFKNAEQCMSDYRDMMMAAKNSADDKVADYDA